MWCRVPNVCMDKQCGDASAAFGGHCGVSCSEAPPVSQEMLLFLWEAIYVKEMRLFLWEAMC